MSDSYTTETIQAQFLNQAFIDKLDQGMDKEAGIAMSAFVRQKLREESFTRKILPPVPISNADLDRDINDQPSVIAEKEPDSVATSLPFTGTPDLRYFTGDRYRITFNKIQSNQFEKSKFELSTYRTDIRTVLQENSIRDLQTQEDENFVGAVDKMTSDNNNQHSITGGVTIPNIMQGVKFLLAQQLPVGCILINQETYADVLTQPASQIGSPLASGLTDGSTNLESYFNFPFVTTIKNNLIPTNTFYVFSQPNYLGQFYELQSPSVYLESRADMIKFFTYEALGVGIGNVNGAVKVTLT